MKSKPRLGDVKFAGCLISRVMLVSLVIVFTMMFVSLYSGIDVSADPITPQLENLNRARELWASQNIRHYRMLVEENSCRHLVEVVDDKVIKTYENTCQQDAITVSALFEQIRRDIQPIKWLGSPGCYFIAVHPTFDARWGYPVRIDYQQEWASQDKIGGWAYLQTHPLGKLSMRACSPIGLALYPVVVSYLVSLP